MRAIMDEFNAPATREIVVKKATQVAYTETLLNIVGYCVDVEPCPILWLLPNEDLVEEMSKNRLAPMIRDTPRIREKVKPPRSRDSANTISDKSFPGGRLAIVGSHAPAQLASRPIRVVIEDENDRFADSAGSEGDPSALARKRQQWFWNAKTIKGSSPTVKGKSKIDRDYQASDMRECWVGCPHCSQEWDGTGAPPDGWQTLKWSQIKWDKETDPETGRTVAHKPETASYQCECCGVLWDDADRYAALTNGPKWIATAPFRGIAGFHYPQWYSTVVRLADVVTEFLSAWGRLPGTAPDIQKQRVFVNTVMAEVWEEEGEGLDHADLLKRGEIYGPKDLPNGILFATMGVDTQGDRLEAQIVGWGIGEESWAISYHVINEDPSQPKAWQELERIRLSTMTTRAGRPIRVMATCVDAGGHHGAEVFAYCTPRRGQKVHAIRGQSGPRPIWPKRASRSKSNHLVHMIGVDTAKDAIYGRLRIPRKPDDAPTPGYVHFPALTPEDDSFDAEYFAQLTSEQVVTRYREGRPYRVWVPMRPRNEALDTFVYAMAARLSLTIRLEDFRPPPAATEVTAKPSRKAPARAAVVPKMPAAALKRVDATKPNKTAPHQGRRIAAMAARFRGQ